MKKTKSNPFEPPKSVAKTQKDQHSKKPQSTLLFISFGIAMTTGAIVWAISPSVTGHTEPWDAPNSYYSLAILIAACAPATLSRWHIWIPILGVYIGQNIYCCLFYHPATATIFPGFIAIAIFGTIPSLLGAIIGALPFVATQLFKR